MNVIKIVLHGSVGRSGASLAIAMLPFPIGEMLHSASSDLHKVNYTTTSINWDLPLFIFHFALAAAASKTAVSSLQSDDVDSLSTHCSAPEVVFFFIIQLHSVADDDEASERGSLPSNTDNIILLLSSVGGPLLAPMFIRPCNNKLLLFLSLFVTWPITVCCCYFCFLWLGKMRRRRRRRRTTDDEVSNLRPGRIRFWPLSAWDNWGDMIQIWLSVYNKFCFGGGWWWPRQRQRRGEFSLVGVFERTQTDEWRILDLGLQYLRGSANLLQKAPSLDLPRPF